MFHIYKINSTHAIPQKIFSTGSVEQAKGNTSLPETAVVDVGVGVGVGALRCETGTKDHTCNIK